MATGNGTYMVEAVINGEEFWYDGDCVRQAEEAFLTDPDASDEERAHYKIYRGVMGNIVLSTPVKEVQDGS